MVLEAGSGYLPESANQLVGFWGNLRYESRTPLIHDLVGADARWRLKSRRTGGGDEIVLIHTVAAHAEAAHQLAVYAERKRSGKKDHAVLIRIGRLGALCTWIEHVELIEREEWPGSGTIQARRIEWPGSETDGTIGDRGAGWNAWKIGLGAIRTTEENQTIFLIIERLQSRDRYPVLRIICQSPEASHEQDERAL
jgi:hypothetical protein